MRTTFPSRCWAALVLLLSSPGVVVVVDAGLRYNNDLQCGYPFVALTIDELACTPTSYYTFGDYNNNEAEEYQNQNQYQQNQQDYADEQQKYYEGGGKDMEQWYAEQQQPGSCLAGELMDVSGSLTIENEKVSKYFDVTLKICWTKWNMNFKCITHTEKVDLGYFALSEEQQQENQQAQEEYQEQQQEQYNNQENGNNNANNPYYWYNPYKDKYSSESMYLYPGTYDYSIRVTIPDNSYTQTDTPANLYLTFKPEESYKHTIFRQRAWWSKIKDYNIKTKCFGTFNGYYQENNDQNGGQGEEQNGDYYYWNYQQQAGVAGVTVVLLAAAGVVVRRQRRVIAGAVSEQELVASSPYYTDAAAVAVLTKL